MVQDPTRPYRLTIFDRQASHRELALAIAHALPTLAWRHHAIGALQAYLSEEEPEVRVHIWHPDLLVFGPEEGGRVHNHRFDLRSSVLVGSVEHHEYHPRPDPEGAWVKHTVIHARAGRPDLPEALPGRYAVDVVEGTIAAGEVYQFSREGFHLSRVTGLAVTLVTKLAQTDTRAELLVPYGHTPGHGFSHKQAVDTGRYVRMAQEALFAGARA